MGEMNYMGKQHLEMLVNRFALGNNTHGGSVPNLLPSPCGMEGLRPRLLHKHLSMDVLRGHTADHGILKWPSLLTICKWKQNLTERLLKRHRSSVSYCQVSSLGYGCCMPAPSRPLSYRPHYS